MNQIKARRKQSYCRHLITAHQEPALQEKDTRWWTNSRFKAVLLHSCFSVLLRVCATNSLMIRHVICFNFTLISTATVIFADPKDVTVEVNEWAQFNCTAGCGYHVSWYMAGHSSAIRRNNTVPGLLIKRRGASGCTESDERTHFIEVLATEAFNKSTFYCAANERRQESCSCGTDGRCYSRPALLKGENLWNMFLWDSLSSLSV